MIEGIFLVKRVGPKSTITGKDGSQISKINVVLTNKECRMGENGTYAQDVDYAMDLIGERADNFTAQEGQCLVAQLHCRVREYNGDFYSEIKLGKYCYFNS